ncbi:hypothetical protein PsAD5_02310 [Pseudovibrio sp. Ad5]|uniref:helix-turn-helix domain-containing protein n=1 Tax=Pseudovibrio sp. Ad5 TaxID=989436 RepID=UPI0007B21292|nr:helix-turn-helix transcriptional regulator [Pseudovibrio sp. Ad5]KZK97461.1 hypothetical protein PsAD5_02310 [Pseudovibrio sp. Ad5]
MTITAAQCRAARSLLEWSQDDLATNARVSRATVADFEANSRRPMRNNLTSMENCMFAGGVDFLSETDGLGVGVRFREPKLEYIKNVDLDHNRDIATIKMRYEGEPFLCIVPFEAIEDFHHANFSTDNEYSRAVSEMLHHILAVVEKQAKHGISNNQMFVDYEMIAA